MSEDEPTVEEEPEPEPEEEPEGVPDDTPPTEPELEKPKGTVYKVRHWISGKIHMKEMTLEEAKTLFGTYRWESIKMKGKGRLLIINDTTKRVIRYN